MCGLVGLVDFDGLDRSSVAPLIERAVARLHPRGPDDRGTWFDARCALGHTRLSIIDLSPAAAQPMERHGAVLAYNGEIYNFAALRSELALAGHSFASTSDTEVLLAGWKAWGKALLPKLNGMFAFALWDPVAEQLWLARDRYGKKPLVYHRQGARVTFASELVALEAIRGTGGAIDMAALGLLFTLRYVPDPMTIIAGVEKLPPGHLACVTRSGIAVERWYDLARERLPRLGNEGAAMGLLRTTVDEAVGARLVADVPLGVFLSGGIDSALIAAAMVRRSETVRSFTLGFEGAADYFEERPAARAIARHLGTEHTELAVSTADAAAALDAVFDGLDEPFADSSAVPTYLLAREARRHVTVALSGDGADEVFGGYRKYQGELMAARYQALPRILRKGAIEPLVSALPERKSVALLERARRARRFAAHAGKDAVGRQAGWMRLMPDDDLSNLLVAPPADRSLETLVADRREEAGDDDPINAMLYADMEIGLVGDMLVKVDRMSMANSLEVRCPFLDHRVVECAAAMPGAFKLARGAGKKILRTCFADRLPPSAFSLPKKGFEIPIAEWLTGPLADLTRRAIDPARLRRQGLFRPELPRAWYDDLAARRRDTAERLWTLIAFQAWSERRGYLDAAA